LVSPGEAPAQTYTAQGPAPITGSLGVRLPPTNPVTGAIQAVLPHPTDSNTIFVGAVNGGIWKTIDGGAIWTPLTDLQRSLSIGALGFDLSNPNRILAGLASFSNSRDMGGPLEGLLYSQDGGATWTSLGGPALKNTNVSSVLLSDQVMLVASRSNLDLVYAPGTVTGLFRSLDGGKSFISLSGSGGLPQGSVTSLAWDPNNHQRVYAALPQKGIYRSDDGGRTWSNVTITGMNISGNTCTVLLSVGAGGGSLFAAIARTYPAEPETEKGKKERLESVWRSLDGGNTWQNMGGLGSGASKGLPGSTERGTFFGVNPGGQAEINLSLVADPLNPNLVYIGGDTQPAPDGGDSWPGGLVNSIGAIGYTGRLFRGDAAQPLGRQWTPLTDNFTNPRSAPHADSRTMAFDANGNLLQVDDGGIYWRLLAASNLGRWESLNGNLQITEFYANTLAYDRNTRTIIGGSQDNGIADQKTPGSLDWQATWGGDGGFVAVNDSPADFSVRYGSSQQLGNFGRYKVDVDNKIIGEALANLMVGGMQLADYDRRQGSAFPFITPVALNRGDMSRLAFGTYRIYLGRDVVQKNVPLSANIYLTDISVRNFDDAVSALAYGRPGNPNILLAGEGDRLWLSTTLARGSLAQVRNYQSEGRWIKDILINPHTDTTFYVADGSPSFLTSAAQYYYGALRATADRGVSWTKGLTLMKPQCLGYIDGAGVKAVLMGGYGALYGARETDLDNWRNLTGTLPRTFISSLSYSALEDLLVVGTMGRGAFTLANAASFVPAAPATVDADWIRLLRADTPAQTLNGGTLQTPLPLDSWDHDLTLTGLGGTMDTAGSNSTLSGIISGPGSFTKTGLGTLTLYGLNTYEGGTVCREGVVNVVSDANLGAASGGLTFNGGGLQAGAGLTSARTVTLEADGGSFHTGTGSAVTSTLSGAISGTGAWQIEGLGKLLLRGVNTYEGGTILKGGTLNVLSNDNLGSATGPLTFNGGTLQTGAPLTAARILAVLGSGGAFDTNGFASNLSGSLYGYGALTQRGTGSITFSADGSPFAGTYNLTAGAFYLTGTLGSIHSPSTLLVQAAGLFRGPGSLVGNVDLWGNGAGFSGDLGVTGRLNLSNTLGSKAGPCEVVILPNGRLTGKGTIIGTVLDWGQLDPGESPGTIRIVGSYTQTGTGAYLVEVAAPGDYDRLAVSGDPGTATLSGIVAPSLLGGYRPRGNQVFPGVITATGGINGAFSTILNPQIGPTLFWGSRYTATSFDLVVQRDYANPGLFLNANQNAVGRMLNRIAGATGGDLNTALDAIDSLAADANVRNAFKQISPEKTAALSTLALTGAGFRMRQLAQRVTDLRFADREAWVLSGLPGSFHLNYSGMGGLMLAYNSSSLAGLITPKPRAAPQSRWGLYFDPSLVLGSQKSSVNQTGFDFTMVGFTAGADYRVGDNLLVGLATGYSHTGAGFYGSGGGVQTHTWPLTAYAAYLRQSFYAYGSLGYALNLFHLERGLRFGGLDRTAKSSPVGHQLNLYGEAGYDLKARPFIITPVASLAYSGLWVDGFTESGAGTLNLRVSPQSAASLQSGVGAKVAVPLKRGSMTIVPQAYATYQHEFENGRRGLDASLSQVGNTFTFQTDAAQKDYASLGANLTMLTEKNLRVHLNYNAEVGRANFRAHSFNAGLRWEF
jgi:outer membrane autotransporter protein